MIQVEPCTLPPGFVAWRDGINEQWAECPWQAAALAARSEPMSERVTTEQVNEHLHYLRGVVLDKRAPLYTRTQCKVLLDDLSNLAADRDEWRARAERAERELDAANAECERLRGALEQIAKSRSMPSGRVKRTAFLANDDGAIAYGMEEQARIHADMAEAALAASEKKENNS